MNTCISRSTIFFLILIVISLCGAVDAIAQDHRIAIRMMDGKAEFYHPSTGEPFFPRGNNYIDLRPDQNNRYVVSSLFSTSYHDAEKIASDFQRMKALGYNTARVFFDLCVVPDCVGALSGGLREDYMDNVVELLELAKRYEIYTILTANWLPDYGGYLDAHESCRPNFDHGNCLLLSEPGVASYVQFFQDFIQALLDRDAPLDIIMAYQLRNEVSLELNAPPLSFSSGMVTAANGKTYNMASGSEKEDLVNEGLVHWANTVRAAILELDPTALVTAGFFAPNVPHEWRPGDIRMVRSEAVLRDSDLDFLDFHPYPGVGLTMEQHAENYGMIGYEEKPIILGEIGAFRDAYSTAEQAAIALRSWQAEACDVGFDGFVLWQWDAPNLAIVGDNVWGPHDGNGEIARVMAPAFNDDPCTAPKANLSLGQPTTASNSLPAGPPALAFDGQPGSSWQAGDLPEQWIEVDLGDDSEVGGIAMLTDQFPAGRTVHDVLGRSSGETDYTLLHTFDQETDFGEWLTFNPETAWENIRFVRILTRISPSWVSWQEINVLPVAEEGYLPLPPALHAPADYADLEPGSHVLAWDAVAGVTSYELQVASDSTFAMMLIGEEGLENTTYTATQLGETGLFFWRIRAMNATGYSPWSNARRFRVDRISNVGVEGSIPLSFAVHPNYPNPFSGSTTFRFDLPEPAFVRLTVYDVLGRSLDTIVAEPMPAGQQRISWQPQGIGNGVYFYRIEAGIHRGSGKLLIVM
ncbi:MAG: discoidin domain-containing protein [Rhodothermaceae bacterium]|nr:discoidin domain-containing protein [Rhodothermaceae bacterium]